MTALVLAGLSSGCSHRITSAAALDRPGEGKSTVRVDLRSPWTPASLVRVTRLITNESSLRVQLVQRPGGKPGWWAVWSDPTRSRRRTLFDAWTGEIAARLYRDHRSTLSPVLSGIGVATRDPESTPPLAGGEAVSAWPRPAHVYLQETASKLAAQSRLRAARVGLRIERFRAPTLGGMEAPLVWAQVTKSKKFARLYEPGCVADWVLGFPDVRPVGASGLDPYFGFFLTIVSKNGAWLQSTAFAPYEAITELSKRATRYVARQERRGDVCRPIGR
jgi:hypothetical protein